MNILAIIPARGGSKGIPLKNLIRISGKPLLDYTVNCALESKHITRIIVSSDHSEILKRAEKLGVEKIRRPAKISRDNSTTEDTIIHCLDFLKKKEKYKPDLIILLQNTSPLRTTKNVDESIELALRENYDSVLSVYPSHHFLWKLDKNYGIALNYNPKKRPMRQKFKNQFVENGAIYITKLSSFMRSKCRISGKIGLYQMNKESSIDIDNESDVIEVEKLLKK